MSYVGLAWIKKRVASLIIAFSSMGEMEEALAAREVDLSEDEECFLEEPYVCGACGQRPPHDILRRAKGTLDGWPLVLLYPKGLALQLRAPERWRLRLQGSAFNAKLHTLVHSAICAMPMTVRRKRKNRASHSLSSTRNIWRATAAPTKHVTHPSPLA